MYSKQSMLADAANCVELVQRLAQDAPGCHAPGVFTTATQQPVKRFWLVTQDITHLLAGPHNRHSKWVVGIKVGMGKRQSDDKTRSLNKRFGRQHHHEVHAFHFPTGLRVVLNPDDISAIR